MHEWKAHKGFIIRVPIRFRLHGGDVFDYDGLACFQDFARNCLPLFYPRLSHDLFIQSNRTLDGEDFTLLVEQHDGYPLAEHEVGHEIDHGIHHVLEAIH